MLDNYFLIISFVCIIIFFSINSLLKKTLTYKNYFCFATNFMCKIPENLDLLVLGSTYSLFDCQAINEFCENAWNMGSFNRPIKYDFYILKKYSKYLSSKSKILFLLSGCICLCSPDYDDTSGTHYAILNYSSMNRPSIKLWCNYHMPILHLGKYLIIRHKSKLSYDEKYKMMIGEASPEELMINRINTWKNQFSLKSLDEKCFTDETFRSIEMNSKILEEIANFCSAKGIQLFIVIPPFSKHLNIHISDTFISKSLYEPIRNSLNNIPILDYRKHPFFQEHVEYFIDGGFLLNYEGSKEFCQLLLKTIENRSKN